MSCGSFNGGLDNGFFFFPKELLPGNRLDSYSTGANLAQLYWVLLHRFQILNDFIH